MNTHYDNIRLTKKKSRNLRLALMSLAQLKEFALRSEYIRDSYSLHIMQVQEFNKAVLNNSLALRKITSTLYLQYTLKGDLRKTGFVTFSSDNAYFSFTRRGAYIKAMEY